jgi:hypothetical protein
VCGYVEKEPSHGYGNEEFEEATTRVDEESVSLDGRRL